MVVERQLKPRIKLILLSAYQGIVIVMLRLESAALLGEAVAIDIDPKAALLASIAFIVHAYVRSRLSS